MIVNVPTVYSMAQRWEMINDCFLQYPKLKVSVDFDDVGRYGRAVQEPKHVLAFSAPNYS